MEKLIILPNILFFGGVETSTLQDRWVETAPLFRTLVNGITEQIGPIINLEISFTRGNEGKR